MKVSELISKLMELDLNEEIYFYCCVDDETHKPLIANSISHQKLIITHEQTIKSVRSHKS